MPDIEAVAVPLGVLETEAVTDMLGETEELGVPDALGVRVWD